MVLQAELISIRVITLWFLVLFQFFIDGMGPFNELFLLFLEVQAHYRMEFSVPIIYIISEVLAKFLNQISESFFGISVANSNKESNT